MFTDKLIEELINCPKFIVDPPKDIKQGRSSSSKKIFSLSSENGQFNFNGFITQNLTFTENFSVGLAYNPKEEKGKIVLLRCNGPHGGIINAPHHAGCHIHKCTAERINNGLKPEGHIEMTDKYSTIDEAIQFYISLINLIHSDRQKHFPPPSGQTDLFNQANDY